MFLSIISVLACLTSTIALLPQIHKTYVTKSAEDLSSLMLWNFCLCSALWTAYGVMTYSKTVWITNVIMLIFSMWLIYLKFIYSKKNA